MGEPITFSVRLTHEEDEKLRVAAFLSRLSKGALLRDLLIKHHEQLRAEGKLPLEPSAAGQTEAA
ncbi:hypothetical protein SAMN04488498_101409 [Mesorhizobium albiziae]|uniref:Ribbon-helix-helix protein, copG family n=1 Tax=Neomesorhizobium albiziae TaxID=335020 RepID=A0A1I3VF78_9HYPH|nr:hypothetical protein GCM10007937_05750 [Mesorhizobium albiziae]SFJ93832.1 hypothetical protein SAMN04488498_101409 [Mesorhizobium albiziae]